MGLSSEGKTNGSSSGAGELHGQRRPATRSIRSYTEQEIRDGLTEMALSGGNSRLASRRLKVRGLSIPHQTLQSWVSKTQLERYDEVRREVVPRVHARIAAEHEDLARLEAEAERKALEVFLSKAENMSAAEASTAGRNWAVTRGISTDKANTMRGKPTGIVEHRVTAKELWRSLSKGVPGLVVEGTAEEISPAEILEPPAE